MALQSAKPTTTATKTAETTPVVKDARSYLAMMLIAIFMMPTGLARAYRGEKAGWNRFWVLIGTYVAMLIPPLTLIGVLIVLVLTVWGLVDVFLLRTTTTDATGNPLATTPTDKQWAKGFFIYLIVALSLTILGFILAISFGVMAAVQCQANPTLNYCTDSSIQRGERYMYPRLNTESF